MAIAATIGSAVIGAGTSIYNANRAAGAQKDLYNAQFAAESQAAIANAEARLTAAAAEAEAIMGGAEASARGQMGAARAEAQGIRSSSQAASMAAGQAADAAYGEAYRNVGLMKQEADESLRRLDAEQTTYEEKARARAAASGGEYTGSTEAHVEGLITENTKQYGWLNKAYKSQQGVARSNAQAERGASYGYAQSLIKAGEAEAEARLGAGSSMAHATLAGGSAMAHATKKVASAHFGGAIKAYGGPTSGRWYDTAFANASAARKRGASFKQTMGASTGYGYAAAKAYGRV